MRDPSALASPDEALSLLGPQGGARDPGRKQAMAAFLARCGWKGLEPVPLAGDASFRRYYRVADNSRCAVLMDAPPPQEDVVPYVSVSQLLRRLGLDGEEPKTLREISARLSLTRERVRQIEGATLARLRRSRAGAAR